VRAAIEQHMDVDILDGVLEQEGSEQQEIDKIRRQIAGQLRL